MSEPTTPSVLTAYAIKHAGLYVREYSDASTPRPESVYGLTGYLADVAVFMFPPSRDTLTLIRNQIGLPDISALTVVEWAIAETEFTGETDEETQYRQDAVGLPHCPRCGADVSEPCHVNGKLHWVHHERQDLADRK